MEVIVFIKPRLEGTGEKEVSGRAQGPSVCSAENHKLNIRMCTVSTQREGGGPEVAGDPHQLIREQHRTFESRVALIHIAAGRLS